MAGTSSGAGTALNLLLQNDHNLYTVDKFKDKSYVDGCYIYQIINNHLDRYLYQHISKC